MRFSFLKMSFNNFFKHQVKNNDRAVRNWNFLMDLAKSRKTKDRWEMILNATEDELGALLDAVRNLIFHVDKLKLKKEHRIRISKYKDSIDKLNRANKKKNILKVIQRGEGITINPKASNKRDRIRYQKGGFIPAVLAPLLFGLAADWGIEKVGGLFKD